MENSQEEFAVIDGFAVSFSVKIDRTRYDPALINAIRTNTYEVLERQFLAHILREGDRVLEAGTAIGAVAMTAAKYLMPENVITFEANPEIFSDAVDNFRRNGLQAITAKNGVLQNRLVARSTRSVVDFYISSNFVASRLDAGLGEDIIKKVEVPVYVLEHEIEKCNVNVLAIDIEGAEVDLLMNADLTSIRKIVLEVHRSISGDDNINRLIKRLINDDFLVDFGISTNEILVMTR